MNTLAIMRGLDAIRIEFVQVGREKDAALIAAAIKRLTK